MTAIQIDSARARAKLTPRKTPYFVKITRGLNLGFRKLDEDRGTWSARLFVGGAKTYEWLDMGEIREGFGFDEARQRAEKWASEIGGGVRVRDDDGKVATVASACRAYVASREKEHEQGARDAELCFRKTVYGYEHPSDPEQRERTSREYKPHSIASISLAKFRSTHLKKWRDELAAGKISKSSVNRRLTHLKAALNFAVEERLAGGALAHEVSLVVPYEAAGGRRRIYLDRDQRRALLAAAKHAESPCSNGALADLVEATALTGARPGELLSAHRSAFDRRTGMLTLDGKTGERTVPLSPPAIALFSRLAESKLPSALLLTRDDGKPFGHSDYDEHLRAAAAAAGLPKGVVLYSLRHSWITEALLSGHMGTLEVARLVGTSVMMIEKHYGHLVASRAKESLAAVKML